MNSWLQTKTAGLPRWAWVTLFGGAVVVGLYLRSHSGEEEPEEEMEETPGDGELSAYEGTETAGGLAAAGLIGPAQGQVVPVEAPYLPEGLLDIFGSQDETIQVLAGAIAEQEPGERTEVIREQEPPESSQGLTGGGSPRRKPHKKHPKPKKQHQRRPRKPAKKPRRQKHPKQRMGLKNNRRA